MSLKLAPQKPICQKVQFLEFSNFIFFYLLRENNTIFGIYLILIYKVGHLNILL